MNLASRPLNPGCPPVTSGLCATAADPFRDLGAMLRFQRDDEVFAQAAPAEFVYLVADGVLRTVRVTEDGRRQVGGFYFAGDMLGLQEEPAYSFSAEALTECRLLAVRRSVLESLAANDGDVARLLWAAGIRELGRMQAHLLHVGRKNALERVAALLADLQIRAGGTVVDLPMSRQDIADYLGLSIETVSRMLSQLQFSHVIALTGLRRVLVEDREQLLRLAA